MKIGVAGFGHFAGVVAACLAKIGHHVVQADAVPHLIREDQRPVQIEPGYGELVSGLNNLRTADDFMLMSEASIIWIAYDVPLTYAGYPDVTKVLGRIRQLHQVLPSPIPFLVSCQWTVGTMRHISNECPGREFVYVMENVRVGKAISDFQAAPIPATGAAAPISAIVLNFFRSLNVAPRSLSWEDVEFAKHSMNTFIALQIAFVNELRRLAPEGISMDDVSRVLLSDARVSPLAPLKAGAPFGGGSLKRDLLVLQELKPSAYTPIIRAILMSNEA